MSPLRSSHRWLIALVLILASTATLAWLVTDSQAWVAEQPAPTAQQVDTARALFQQVDAGRETRRASEISLDSTQLRSVATMTSQIVAPYRVDADLTGDRLQLTLSRPFLFRWFNLRAHLSGRSEGFPAVRLQLGALSLPSGLSRYAIRAARTLLILRGAQLPPLDTLVQSTAIGGGTAKAAILFPQAGAIDPALGRRSLPVETAAVASIYCKLARAQEATPEPLFGRQLARALAASRADGNAKVNRDGAALVALAMLIVDPQVGELAGNAAERTKPCAIPAPAVILRGRNDLAKHWALSAALTVVTGGQVAAAMGEWKELSDSLTSGTDLAPNDRSGFSFVDLAADRAGYFTALALADPAKAPALRARLLTMSEGAILPSAALGLDEDLSNAEFTRRFGATDDPRFDAEVRRIDDMLRTGGIG